MQTESSANYYYRYKVNSELDWTAETMIRRLSKIKHNNADTVLFDWTEFSFDENKSAGCLELLSSYFSTSNVIGHLFTFQQIKKGVNLLRKPFWPSFKTVIYIHVQIEDSEQLKALDQLLQMDSVPFPITLHLSPRTSDHLRSFAGAIVPTHFKNYNQYFWHFKSYNSKLNRSLTVQNIGHFFRKHKVLPFLQIFKNGRLKKLEIWNEQIPNHYELECETQHCNYWEYKTTKNNILLSVIIPSFNNCKFLVNVLQHLIRQDISAENFEIIIVEDGGLDHSANSARLLFESYANKINLKFIYWPKNHPTKGNQSFFRAGQARNLGVRFSQGENLVFLDSDMLVPAHFLFTCLQELQKADLIQFQRFHIQQQLSQMNPIYQQIDLPKQTYIEERHYWSQLFYCSDWHQLENFWKFTCTYALAIKKSDFLNYGRFKKYYVSYGFEDTDLGYEMYRRGKKFKLVPLPLLHLTSYDQMQYKNSSLKRASLLKKTAAQFYLQHLEEEIFSVLENYFRFQKPILNAIRDLL